MRLHRSRDSYTASRSWFGIHSNKSSRRNEGKQSVLRHRRGCGCVTGWCCARSEAGTAWERESGKASGRECSGNNGRHCSATGSTRGSKRLLRHGEREKRQDGKNQRENTAIRMKGKAFKPETNLAIL